jgi:hypothetical protein
MESTPLYYDAFIACRTAFSRLPRVSHAVIAIQSMMDLSNTGYTDVTNHIRLVSVSNPTGVRYGKFILRGTDHCLGHEFDAEWEPTTFIVSLFFELC